ncbi:fimbria/pilus outer membrane usher protein [Nitrosomonas sp. ANs5]|uniref:fimbria/pilus outer membrane usher protein n=1 Tax=Nitrosomonas sp. ANs5 TaxID=3423941 RepID=UPI003D3315D1
MAWARESDKLPHDANERNVVKVKGETVAVCMDGMAAYQESIFDVSLNGRHLKQNIFALISPDRDIWVRQQDLPGWRLPEPIRNEQACRLEEQVFILLNGIESIKYSVNAATQSLQIEVPPDQLPTTTINLLSAWDDIPQIPAIGGFVNYDFSAQRFNGAHMVGGLAEIGMFAGGGVMTTQFLGRDLSADRSVIRLESTLTLDDPERMASLRVGDTVSRGGAWGRPVRLLGLQWGTNFATRPDYITFPLPAFSGSAALPSTAEVYINNVLTYQENVEAGPFSIRELPVVTGMGEVRMVVRDLLGREQILHQPYYAARNLLKRGLSDFSYEIGWARRNFASRSNDYGNWLLSGTKRYGWNDGLTTEVRGELSVDHRVTGLSGVMLFPTLGIFDAGFAASHSGRGVGGLIMFGFDRLTQRMSLGARTQITSRNFDQLGFQSHDTVFGGRISAPAQQTTAHIGWRDARLGSFGLSYLRMDNRHASDSELISASYNQRLGRGWFMGLTAIKSLRETSQHSLGLTLTYALDERTTVNMNTNWRDQGSNAAMMQVQRNLPPGTGMGYRILAGKEGGERLEAGLNMQNDYGTYMLEAAHSYFGNALRASLRGGFAFLGGEAFLARQLGDSFAVVQVPGYPDVQVYAENQPVARTNAAGNALVPRLRPYQRNRLSIEQMDLPLGARVDVLEQHAIPYFRSGLTIEFPVHQANDALLRIIAPDGQVAASGTLVQVVGQEELFPVALDGQVFLSGLANNNQLRVKLPDGQVCELELNYSKNDDPLPDLGDFYCEELIH